MSIPTWDVDKLDGEEFQDFVKQALWRDGIAMEFYTSSWYQKYEGEGPPGIEVKLDRQLRDTGNVFIEFAHDPSKSDKWEDSGIERDPRVWLWAIGDPTRFAVVQKSILRLVRRKGEHPIASPRKKGDVPTKGFLLPWGRLEEVAGKVYLRGLPQVQLRGGATASACSQCRELADELNVVGICKRCETAPLRRQEANG